MPYRIDLPPKVEKVLDGLNERTFRQLDKEISRLHDDPRPPGCKKLENDIYRVRSGDWRIIYAVFDREKLVQLIRVVRRNEATYRGFH